MAIDLPRIGRRRSRFDPRGRDLKLPDLKLDDIERPRFDLPKMDLPKVDLPKVDLPDLSGAGRAVGEGIETIGDRIGDLGREMRQVRVTRGPEPRFGTLGGPTAGVALLGGLGIGMGLMYFFDPRQGERRRRRLLDRITDLVNLVTGSLGLSGSRGGRGEDASYESWGTDETAGTGAGASTAVATDAYSEPSDSSIAPEGSTDGSGDLGSSTDETERFGSTSPAYAETGSQS